MSADSTLIETKIGSMDATLAALPSVDFWIEESITAHNKAAWGNVYHTAMACWVLHHLTMSAREAGGGAGIAGPVQSQRTGDVSVTYLASPGLSGITMNEGDLPATTWGRLYLRYRATRAVGHVGVI
jgi:hypothetical protein